MNQDEHWMSKYEEVTTFLKTNHRNISKYNLEERRLYTWLKHNRKVMKAGEMKAERVEKFRELMEMHWG